ncbi:winged helix-turn-helix transcriptional regulator [Candidatus Woesearchaeota archaeon]|jgi:DNA-binding transcriptional ArsR family regulator|nr:winged helix-turn-helix transcriptional regulator [Candidatus Woesearchaeota archaeon]MBT4114056.1 winged helix-turn-helix transcriptional regulator [Candidatus Woesearchaeota archaeon]MBT4248600.1 winged helix-turn-helix transcriptional regulator [Candidatus Woesearchaeota archaeon]
MTVKFLSAKTAKMLSNQTARKILETLDKKKSVSQIAKELDLPLTTVDYNITQLEKAGLIKSGYYKWSPRGNKMKLYELAGEIFVYAPEQKPGLLDAMNRLIIPAVLGISAVSGFITQKLFYSGGTSTSMTEKAVTDSFLQSGSETTLPVVRGVVSTATNSIDTVNNAVVENITNTTVYVTESTSVQAEPQLWFWFMVAAGLAMLVLYLFRLRNRS